MKPIRQISTVMLLFFHSIGNAQAPINASVTDCNLVTKNIQTSLSSGKAIIIASKGVDCSICASSAAGWQTWAQQNNLKVEVWGAITYKYNPATFNPACTATNNWVNQYNWNSIFAFPDLNRDWVGASFPRYYVYSPVDSTIIYEGPSSSIARSTAINASIVGIHELINPNDILWQQNGNQLTITLKSAIFKSIQIYSSKGQLVSKHELKGKSIELNQNQIGTGIFIFQFIGKQSYSVKRLISRNW